MKSLNNSLQMYKKVLQETYRALIAFITKFQRGFKNKHPEYEVLKVLYQGYLDLSFFTFTTEQLKPKQLKIAVVFLYKKMRFAD